MRLLLHQASASAFASTLLLSRKTHQAIAHEHGEQGNPRQGRQDADHHSNGEDKSGFRFSARKRIEHCKECEGARN